jgi:hypothetical protein
MDRRRGVMLLLSGATDAMVPPAAQGLEHLT